MSILSADLHKAIMTVWDAADLNAAHTQYWTGQDILNYPVVHDMEATPGQPFPYTVFEQSPSLVVSRMSGHTVGENHHIHDVPWNFRIHASSVGASTAKKIATSVAEEIMKVYGGHPTVYATPLELDSCAHLITQYETDYGMRTGDDHYQWIIGYIFRLDVPVAK